MTDPDRHLRRDIEDILSWLIVEGYDVSVLSTSWPDSPSPVFQCGLAVHRAASLHPDAEAATLALSALRAFGWSVEELMRSTGRGELIHVGDLSAHRRLEGWQRVQAALKASQVREDGDGRE